MCVALMPWQRLDYYLSCVLEITFLNMKIYVVMGIYA